MSSDNKTKRYELIKYLGDGAFATVYLANDRKLNRKVAIKMFKQSEDSDQLTRFIREANICRNLRHPNIIRIFDATISSNAPNIVMEYVEAGSLLDFIERDTLTIDDILSIAEQTGNALSYLHSEGIIHRDIKPENIMIEKPLRAIVMDFNLASSKELTLLTREGFAVGTPRFMAPEIFKGLTASKVTDIYSLGIVIHEMLTSGALSKESFRYPVAGFDAVNLPSYYKPSVPEELDSLVKMMTQVDPALRMQTMNDVIHEISQIRKCLREKQSVGSPNHIGSPRPIESQNPVGSSNRVGSSRPIDSQNPEKSYCSSQVKTRGDVYSRKKGALIFILAVFLIVFLRYSLSTSQKMEPSQTNNTSEKLLPLNGDKVTPKDLLSAAVKCEGLLFSYTNLAAFLGCEEALLKNQHTEDDIVSHCSLLKEILLPLKIQFPFRKYVEYLYRKRLLSLKDANEEPSILPLLTKATTMYLENLSKASEVSDSQTLTAQFFFSELFLENLHQQSEIEEVVHIFLSHYHSLNRKIRESREGKALLHCIVLGELYLEKIRPGAETMEVPSAQRINNIFLIPPSYENEIVQRIREKCDFRKEKFSGHIQSEREWFLADFKRFLEDFILVKADIKQSRGTRLSAANMTHLNLGSGDPFGSKELSQRYDDLLKKNVFYLKKAWYLLNLDENSLSWGRPVATAAINCLQYDDFRFKTLYMANLRDPEVGLGSQKFLIETLPLLIDGLKAEMSMGGPATSSFVLIGFDEAVKLLNPLMNKSVKVQLTEMINYGAIHFPDIALCMRILLSDGGSISVPETVEVSERFQQLMKSSGNLSDDEFKNWAMVLSIVSNKLFLEMKKEGRNKERLSFSLDILKVINKFYSDELFIKVPNSEEDAWGGELLRRATIIHCLDAFIEEGRDFFSEQSELAKSLNVKPLLSFTSTSMERAHVKGGTLAAGRLLKGEALLYTDILSNPLSYR
jgi:serine/threonine protein kinase